VLVERDDGQLELMTADAFDASVQAEPMMKSDYAVQTSPPGAALWLDGQFRGNTPGTLTLEGNTKGTLHLELPAHEPLELELEPDGKPHPLTLRLAPKKGAVLAWATFDLDDDMTVWLDDVLVAQGRVRLPVEAGVEHSWRVERDGHRSAARTFTLEAGREQSFATGD
jgi:hypothetical protein